MSIRIDTITRGRFGNKLLQYNSLCQLGNNHNTDISCCNFDDGNFFKSIIPFIRNNKPKNLLFCKDVIENTTLDFNTYSYTIDDPAYCLHNTFFKVTKKDPREFLELKQEYKPLLDKDTLYIGIHLRGGDIISKDGNNGREIHEFEYYKNSIHFIMETFCKDKKYIFVICTDDKHFISYRKTINYLQNNNIQFTLGQATSNSNNHYIYDWALLSECDILINSSSTFCITAGFLGKKNKIIIHSQKWIHKNIHALPWNNKTTGKVVRYTLLEFRHTFNTFWINVNTDQSKFYYYNFLL